MKLITIAAIASLLPGLAAFAQPGPDQERYVPTQDNTIANPDARVLLENARLPETPEEFEAYLWYSNNLDSIHVAPGDTTPKDEPTEGHEIVGCVQLPIEFGERSVRARNPWPPGTNANSPIPYEFDGNVSQANRNIAVAAMQEIEGNCRVDFRPREFFDTVWIRWNNSNGNNAPVGWVPFGGQRTVNIVSWGTYYTVVHELFHVIGVYHEQSRRDRDSFVTINFGNISNNGCGGGDCAPNFQIENNTDNFGYYDFNSIMHYPPTAFSNNGQNTITCQPAYARYQGRIGNRAFLSEQDAITMHILYPPDFVNFVDRGVPPGGNGFFNLPNNTVRAAYDAAPDGGKVVFKSTGNHDGRGVYNRRTTWHSPDGSAVVR
jgi:hypothetical protein